MLAALHDKIIKVIPINGVSKDWDGNISVSYIDQPNDSQLQEINQIINSWPLEEEKIKKLAQIDAEWNKTIVQGWDSGQGILGISAEDVALYSGNFSMAKEAANLGYPIPPIITVDSQEISFSDIQSMTIFMLQYGEFRSSISKTFAARRRAVQNASTIEEVVVI